MKILIFDTETSGLDPQWNVILQLSYQIVDSETWQTLKTVNHYFPWPEERSRVNERAIEVNGLTEERLSCEQLSDRKTALEEFVADKDSCGLIVAHNLDFDKKFILASCKEAGVKYAQSGWNNTYDTMKKTVRYCEIPKSYGSGYKWPKLTELADCLWVDYKDINLHDSAGDVELTKRCFESLVAEGQYHFPDGETITVKIQVESPTDIKYTAYDQKGEEINEIMLGMLVSKSRWKGACEELLQIWTEDNEEERKQYIKIYERTPAVKKKEDFSKMLSEIVPNKYSRKPFEEPKPNYEELKRNLEEEAKNNVSSILFWTIKKKRQAYVEDRLDTQFNELMEAYNDRLANHEKAENEAEIKFNEKSEKACTEARERIQGVIEGNLEYVKASIAEASILGDFPLPYKVECEVLQDLSLHAIILLPMYEDLPKLHGVRMASGKYKVKELSDKELRADYAECITGLAFYVAANLINTSPQIPSIRIDAHAKRRDMEEMKEVDEYLYSVAFSRDDIQSIQFDGFNPIEGITQFPHLFNSTKTNIIKSIDISKPLVTN